MLYLGIDVGGTHTDLISVDETGKIYSVDKNRTDKNDIAGTIIEMIQANHKESIGDIKLLINGTTIGTNAILEKKIPDIILVNTKGFRDDLIRSRETKEKLTDLQWDKPEPLTKRKNILEVDERIDFNGSIYKELSDKEIRKLVIEIKKRNIKDIAVVLIHSFANPVHEEKIKEAILKEIPDAEVTMSIEVVKEWREFERNYNTMLAAALKPTINKYLNEFIIRLKKIGFKGEIEIMQANAGVASIDNIKKNPTSTLFSGVTGGVVGGILSLKEVREENSNFITFDMGGTSTDICLVSKGKYNISFEKELEWNGQLKFPCVDVHSIGAGGGSIAWVDEAGHIHVGPQSAGAIPGPVCYNTEGKEPTVTDANLVLGYLNPDNYLGGKYKLSVDKAKVAIEKLAKRINLDYIECALGIRSIINYNMVYGIRHVSIERGYDPREYDLIAFGGAGPMHCADLLKELNLDKTYIPIYPGNVSAMGLLGAPPRSDVVKTTYQKLDDTSMNELEKEFKSLDKEAAKGLKNFNINKRDIKFKRSIDMRYTGQTHEINIEDIPTNLKKTDKKIIKEMFDKKHNQLYEFYNKYEPAAIINLRVAAYGPEKQLKLKQIQTGNQNAKPFEERELYFKDNDKVVKKVTPIFKREVLPEGYRQKGPMIIEENLTTTLVPPGFNIIVLKNGIIELTKAR